MASRALGGETPLRLLLVEDDPDDALLIEGELTSAFGTIGVQRADSLREALQLLSVSVPDVVLLDLGLPDSVGLDTFRGLSAVVPFAPVVILSGRDDGDDSSLEAIRLGAQDYVPKSAIASGLLPRVVHHAIRRVEVETLRRGQGDLFEALASNSLDSVHVIDEGGVVIYVQPSAAGSADDLLGRAAHELVHPDQTTEWETALLRLITLGEGAVVELTIQLQTPKGYRWTEMRMTNLLEHPAVVGIVVNTRDITDRRDFEQRLRYQATHDTLTGLPNRALVPDTITAAFDRAEAAGTTVAVLFLDLDRFKIVNDTNGHDAGDQLLVAVADRLRSVVRDTGTVARHGGDEFVIVAEKLSSVDDALALGARIQQCLSEPIRVGDHQVYTTASIGAAVGAHGDTSPETLLSNADAAMYQAKRLGRGRVELFDLSLGNDINEQNRTEAELRVAIEAGQFCVHFQPIVDVSSRTIRSLEAFVRWDHPERGLLHPTDFVEVAQEAGLLSRIDRWVLRAACDQVAAWQTRFGLRLGVNVNVSAATVTDRTFPACVEETLRRTEIESGRLCVELTEMALLLYPTQAEATVKALRSFGVHVALDDFGTGYSSLTCLQNLPLTGIKIDRSFVSGLGLRERDTVIVRSTVNLGRDLDLRVTAEGVESADQLAILATYGCDLAQGYLLDRPLPATDLERRFADAGVGATGWRSPLDHMEFDRAGR